MASPPNPDYAAAGNPPNIRMWNRHEQTVPWVPPACTGWDAKGAGVLVAVAGSFFDGSSEDLLKRFGSISRLEGLRYWSVTEAGWRTLITHATALDGPDLDHPRTDFTVAEMKSGSELYFAQSDNRASGEIIYRMQVKQTDPFRLTIAVENVTAVRRFLITFFEPGDLQSVHYLERNGPGPVELLRVGLGRRARPVAATDAGCLIRQPRASALPALCWQSRSRGPNTLKR